MQPIDLARWIEEQPMFFVATAPRDGHVNVSPKGYDTFRVLGATRAAYLDLTGSGVETIAHLRENGRVTLMWCAFSGNPRICRLYGAGTVHELGSAGFAELAPHFELLPGSRAIIDTIPAMIFSLRSLSRRDGERTIATRSPRSVPVSGSESGSTSFDFRHATASSTSSGLDDHRR